MTCFLFFSNKDKKQEIGNISKWSAYILMNLWLIILLFEFFPALPIYSEFRDVPNDNGDNAIMWFAWLGLLTSTNRTCTVALNKLFLCCNCSKYIHTNPGNSTASGQLSSIYRFLVRCGTLKIFHGIMKLIYVPATFKPTDLGTVGDRPYITVQLCTCVCFGTDAMLASRT